MKFRQIAHYIWDNNLSFIDREGVFNSKEEALKDLERVACRINPLRERYKCVVFEVNKKNIDNNALSKVPNISDYL